MDADVFAAARAAIEATHDADPDGGERRYGERVLGWCERLRDRPDDVLRLAALAQHLERWAIPRADYPEGRKGYLDWRRAVQERQGHRLAGILAGAGVEEADRLRAAELVAKKDRGDDGQLLEDAACLVFFEHEAEPFLAKKDYSEEKVLAIVRKTWAKMSEAARRTALAEAELSPAVRTLTEKAIG